MGTATRKATKAMSLRTNLTSLAMGKDKSVAQGAKKRHKAINDQWHKRNSNSVKDLKRTNKKPSGAIITKFA